MNHPWEWLFDGVGGAAALALIGFAYRTLRSSKDETPHSIVSEVVDVSADDSSVAVSNRSSGHSSPVVLGSHNTINISHTAPEAKVREGAEVLRDGEEKEQAKFSWGDAFAVFIGIPAFFCFVGGLIWVASHLGTARGVLQGNRAAATIAYQYGKGITPKEFSHTGDQDTSCSEAGITCFGEDSIPSTAIPIPEEDGGNWSRIAVIVNYQEGGDSSRILISTKSKDISLNYANHRDGSTYKQIEFQMEDVKALSGSQRSYWFPVDVMYRETGVSFPITVTVEEDRRRPHFATAIFVIPRKDPTPPNSPRIAKASHTFSAATGRGR
jgi:hypothetical protein